MREAPIKAAIRGRFGDGMISSEGEVDRSALAAVVFADDGSRRWLDFIAQLEDHFDWAIIDSPPVLAVADSCIAANRASGLVFVVNSDKTSRQSAQAALEQVTAANAHIIGSILNRVELSVTAPI